MITAFLFVLAFLFYSVYCAMAYMQWDTKAAYLFWGLLVALMGNACWLLIAARLNPKMRYVAGLGFDLLVAVAFLVIPVMFYGIKLSKWGWVGISVAVAGILIAKVGG